jgi:hypothetical protein
MAVTVCCDGGEVQVIKGTDKTIKLTVTNADTEAAIDLTNAAALFIVKLNEDDSDNDAKIIKKTANLAGGGNEQAEVTDATNGELKVYLIPADTSSLDDGTYYWGARIKTNDGKQFATTVACSMKIRVAIASDPI